MSCASGSAGAADRKASDIGGSSGSPVVVLVNVTVATRSGCSTARADEMGIRDIQAVEDAERIVGQVVKRVSGSSGNAVDAPVRRWS